MLNTLQSANKLEHHRNRRREKRLWHDGTNRYTVARLHGVPGPRALRRTVYRACLLRLLR